MELKLELKPVEVIKKPAPYEVGIDEVKDVVICGVEFANAIIKAYEDESITLSDIVHFIKPVTKIPAALTDIAYVPAELDNLTEVEVKQLVNIVKDQLVVDDQKAKVIVEESIKTLYQLYQLMVAIKQ